MLPAVAIVLPALLTARQPDLGTAVLMSLVGFGLMVMAGVNILYFVFAGAAGLAAMPFVLANLHDYQRRRLDVFLDPGRDPLGAGYHITQSKIALASGGFSGQGYLQGPQSQLDFLPEKHTDFIFTTIGEEWGFVGAAGVLVLFGCLVTVLIGMAIAIRSQFGRLLDDRRGDRDPGLRHDQRRDGDGGHPGRRPAAAVRIVRRHVDAVADGRDSGSRCRRSCTAPRCSSGRGRARRIERRPSDCQPLAVPAPSYNSCRGQNIYVAGAFAG